MEFFGHRQSAADAAQGPLATSEIDEAYERGRRDGRRSHRRHPILGLIMGVLAIAGAASLGFAAREGSFAAGGEVLDRQLAIATGQAQVASRDAAAATGHALKDAGDSLRDRAG